ncbi:hypothetical protein POJ06DRAFT_250076 [Lipomyces tetrasporus]|uniref:NEDD8-activating enzyme E1 regulatory subunit n=1 Tax=Lipomyces tetrasporus TaxID=54092 RepID=A0AAD7QT43_9ASCO|nr:uncharacterized protein POJ06DRAFT_250076 [Lipomyces tetrasporus]KAJ8100978.1 hypothetical protein POJ06DRAFT_250076 [Lipomyces tetrasporus]
MIKQHPVGHNNTSPPITTATSSILDDNAVSDQPSETPSTPLAGVAEQFATMLQVDAEQPSTPHVLTARDKKYDRQLRLWAANGQAALEEAHVLLLTASAAGAEILKNLVLPGTGAFTIADDKLVTEDDIDANFFLNDSSLGQPRAVKVTEFLQELNTDSMGHSQILNLRELDGVDSSYWESFSLVIAHQIRPSILMNVAKVLWDKKIPLVLSNSIGFYGYLRIVIPEHTVVESHPDSTVDLRLDCPWPELEHFADAINMDALDEIDHAHVPYVVILLKYLKQWKAEHGGSPPSIYAEKNQFKDLIRSGIRSSDPENFDEAIAAVLRATQKTTVPITSVLNDPRAQNLHENSTKFWILARAAADFVAKEGNLPLSGTLPDMKADSLRYIALQTVYRNKAVRDRDWVKQRVAELLSALDRPTDAILDDEIETFCKFSRYIVVIDGRSLEEEYNPETAKAKLILSGLREENGLMPIYLGFRAVEIFEERNERFPGSLENTEDDAKNLESIALEIVKSLGGDSLGESASQVLKEFVRAGSGELHNISSLLGGFGAQEVVKLITRQYVPMKNTVVFDGIQSKSEVWEL